MISRLSIRDLENLSGIKAHTIRMWEKRYSIFEPDRTPTNIRTYSHQDLKKLLNITTLLDSGMKISRASSLNNDQLHSEIESLISFDEDHNNAFLTNKLIVATLKCDIYAFEDTYAECIKMFGLEETIEEIVYPLLGKIGMLWSVNKLYPAQEHFASQLLRQKLYSAINSLPQRKGSKKFLLYLPDDENHEIGLLYGYYLIRKAGYECIYLGSSVPFDGVMECAELTNPTHILTLFITSRPDNKLSAYLDKISNKLLETKLLIGGGGVQNSQCTMPECNNLMLLSGIDDLKKILSK